MDNLPLEVTSTILQNVLGSQVNLSHLIQLSRVNSKFKQILSHTLYFWNYIALNTAHPNWILENCAVMDRITVLTCGGNPFITHDILKALLQNCKNLKNLDISNCKNISIVNLIDIFKGLSPSDTVLKSLLYIDITGIGELTFKNFEIFHEYWFEGSGLISDLQELFKVIPPETLIMPSVCQKCQRDTCYPPDTHLKCIFCDTHVYWVCDDCESESYKICYICVQEDSENGIDTVACFDCLMNENQRFCPKCSDWKCPTHFTIDCMCG